MLSRILADWFLFCLVAFGVVVISGCSDSSYHDEKVTQPDVVFSTSNEESNSNEESKLNEYIIVLAENVSIEKAISSFQKYQVQVIRDLNRGRYLISLKNDPGIEQLKEAVEDSALIKQIQINFSYTIQ